MALVDLQRLRLIARPVVLATGLVDAPIGVCGTAFLVGYKASIFAITAKHVVLDHPSSKILIFPTAKARKGLGITHSWNVTDNGAQTDRADLYVMRCTPSGMPRHIRQSSRVYPLDAPLTSVEWFEDRWTSTFFVFGFPGVFNLVDYSREELNTGQVLLQGNYVGPSVADDVHQLVLRNPHDLDDFGGLSGSPVFSVENVIGRPARVHLCGMAIRGWAGSGALHFIDSVVIKATLDDAVERITGGSSEAL